MNLFTISSEEQWELLNSKAQPVMDINEEIKNHARDMLDFMAISGGIGLAAPQIGELKRMFVVKADDDIQRVFINPEIIETSIETDSYEEGCLSIPGSYAEVIRPAFIQVQAWNERGRPFKLEAEGLLATVIQHELDHLNGILFIDRLSERAREKLLKIFTKRRKM